MRRVFFSFHFARDSWRAGQVRNSWVTQRPNQRAGTGFTDAAAWETVKRSGEAAIQRWIAEQMSGTSVTVVLIGNQTSQRPWVRYEIERSYDERKGLLGVYVHGVRDAQRTTDTQGANPFDITIQPPGLVFSTRLSTLVPTYDWIAHDGYRNLSSWIEHAAAAVGR